jgi:hypothetical protein
MAQPTYTHIIDLRPSLLPVNVNFIVLDKGTRSPCLQLCFLQASIETLRAQRCCHWSRSHTPCSP